MYRQVKTTPRKRPRQARSKDTVEAILAATARVLVKQGFDGLTTNAVAEGAGVSIGSLYQYFKSNGTDPGAQIEQLEAQLQKGEAAGAASPPGLHGHLALLYSKLGDEANAVKHLEAERSLFPESANYINFLLKNAAKPASKS